MNDETPTPNHPYARRQKILVLVAGILITLYFASQSSPDVRRNGTALFSALVVAGLGIYVVGLAKRSRPRRRIALLISPLLVMLVVALFCWPNFRRARLQRQLQGLGATVTSKTDPGEGMWFRSHGILLPTWVKEQLGDAFFGEIIRIDFSYRSIPVDALAVLHFDGPVETLDLRFSKITNDDLIRLTRVIDAKRVVLNSMPVDSVTLEAFGDMPSLGYIAAIQTDISLQEASDFATTNPGITVVYGDNTGGWSIIPPSITEPQATPKP